MKIAVVGGTGNIGAPLCRQLLASGHQVRALSRGGQALDQLVKLGAEPFLGSFDAGTSNLDAFFRDADAAFTMVRSDWSNLQHYRDVAARLAEALRSSPVRFIVNLSSLGADLQEKAGHSGDFHRLEQTLNGLSGIRIVHLRAGWFMENFLGQIDGIVRYGKLASMIRTDLKLPCIAIRDIAPVAAREFLNPATDAVAIRELLGSEDLTMAEVAALISTEIGRPVEAAFISPDRKDVRETFLDRFGSAQMWAHRVETYSSFNEGRVRSREPRSLSNSQPTRFAEFLRDTWLPAYQQRIVDKEPLTDTFQTWLCTA